MNDKSRYADVLLPLALPGLFTYLVPDELFNEIKPLYRVSVQFGKRKLYTAVVVRVHNNPPEGEFSAKQILSVIDDQPVINSLQMEFWEWISEYYMCSAGEVFKAALPSGLKLESESRLSLTEGKTDYSTLTDQEYSIILFLEKNPLVSVRQLTDSLENKKSITNLKQLIDKGYVQCDETLIESYKPKLLSMAILSESWAQDQKLNDLLDKLQKAPKQHQLIMDYLELSGYRENIRPGEVEKSVLLNRSGGGVAAFNALVKKGILISFKKETSRLEKFKGELKVPSVLNPLQEEAFNKIDRHFSEKDVCLLHGVTSSGKTEIYIHLINKALEEGKQVLYLLPEIAITTQIINRLKSVFGDLVAVYHSKFSDAERIEIWNNMVKTGNETKKFQIILGVRSSVFLPFDNLGLVIIDEEHENTYKQYDPAPRYHARDASIMLARLHHAKVLLGTATPSIESYFNAVSGKYGLVELNARFLDIEMPEIYLANVREARRKKQLKSHFTPLLLNSIQNALENNQQVILFQNRRGFAPYLECESCGWIPQCKNCDVSLTYHKQFNKLVCHYCGHAVNEFITCKECGSNSMATRGFGTQKIEDEIKLFFPDARVSRMDLDSAHTRKSYERLIAGFETGKIDILIGTQMVSKGLDFVNVQVVGVLNADNMLNFPDFRAHERSYQLMAQVSGRAGRKQGKGTVIIQTSDPENPIIRNVLRNNYTGLFNSQLRERKHFNYPPFVRLINLTLKHKNRLLVDRAADLLAKQLKSKLDEKVIGPEYPIVNRIQNRYQKCILMKLAKDRSIPETKTFIADKINSLKDIPELKSVRVVIDVDPM